MADTIQYALTELSFSELENLVQHVVATTEDPNVHMVELNIVGEVVSVTIIRR